MRSTPTIDDTCARASTTFITISRKVSKLVYAVVSRTIAWFFSEAAAVLSRLT